jgi:hypothetical protein
MERAYMPPAVPPPLEHDAWGAPHPKAAVAGPPARTAGFDPIADHRFPQRRRRPMPHTCHSPRLVSLLPLIRKAALHAIRDRRQNERRLIVLGPVDKLVADKRDALIRRRAPKALPVR